MKEIEKIEMDGDNPTARIALRYALKFAGAFIIMRATSNPLINIGILLIVSNVRWVTEAIEGLRTRRMGRVTLRE